MYIYIHIQAIKLSEKINHLDESSMGNTHQASSLKPVRSFPRHEPGSLLPGEHEGPGDCSEWHFVEALKQRGFIGLEDVY